MSIITLVEFSGNSIKPKCLKALIYAKETSQKLGIESVALVVGQNDFLQLANLSYYGISKVFFVNDKTLNIRQTSACTNVLVAAVRKENCTIVITSHDFYARSVAAQAAVELSAGLVLNAIAAPVLTNSLIIKKRTSFAQSSSFVKINTSRAVITVEGELFEHVEIGGNAQVNEIGVDSNYQDELLSTMTIKRKPSSDLSEANIVVSGGLGLQSDEDWRLLKNLAAELGAAIGCTKPVVDQGLIAKQDYIGKDGLSIAPDLYIAIGISGDTHHVSGLKNAKSIFVINKDPEAPFLQTADFAIVGDLKIVLPKLIKEIQAIKSAQSHLDLA